MKKILSVLLALVMLLSLATIAFAEDLPPLQSLDTSTIDGKHYAYVGVENYVVIYPAPEEAEARFDVRNAVITTSDDSVISVRPEKEEDFRFGSVMITGKKLGKATVTVTEPESGVSVSFKVVVLPGIIIRLQNFINSLQYIPYFIGMKILGIFGR